MRRGLILTVVLLFRASPSAHAGTVSIGAVVVDYKPLNQPTDAAVHGSAR